MKVIKNKLDKIREKIHRLTAKEDLGVQPLLTILSSFTKVIQQLERLDAHNNKRIGEKKREISSLNETIARVNNNINQLQTEANQARNVKSKIKDLISG